MAESEPNSITERTSDDPLVRKDHGRVDPCYLLTLVSFAVAEEMYKPCLSERKGNESLMLRLIAESWMLRVCEEQQSGEEVFPHAVNYLEEYLNAHSLGHLTQDQFRLLGASCLFLASRLKGTTPLTTKTLMAYAGNSFTLDQLLREIDKLNKSHKLRSAQKQVDQFRKQNTQLMEQLCEAISMNMHWQRYNNAHIRKILDSVASNGQQQFKMRDLEQQLWELRQLIHSLTVNDRREQPGRTDDAIMSLEQQLLQCQDRILELTEEVAAWQVQWQSLERDRGLRQSQPENDFTSEVLRQQLECFLDDLEQERKERERMRERTDLLTRKLEAVEERIARLSSNSGVASTYDQPRARDRNTTLRDGHSWHAQFHNDVSATRPRSRRHQLLAADSAAMNETPDYDPPDYYSLMETSPSDDSELDLK